VAYATKCLLGEFNRILRTKLLKLVVSLDLSVDSITLVVWPPWRSRSVRSKPITCLRFWPRVKSHTSGSRLSFKTSNTSKTVSLLPPSASHPRRPTLDIMRRCPRRPPLLFQLGAVVFVARRSDEVGLFGQVGQVGQVGTHFFLAFQFCMKFCLQICMLLEFAQREWFL
jgi:hypothetical protein